MERGGYTRESGRLMQQLIELHDLCASLDVRDDHLCEERGQAFSQQALRDALATPIRRIWQAHARVWFCGTRIDSASLSLYVAGGSKRHRPSERRGGMIDERETADRDDECAETRHHL